MDHVTSDQVVQFSMRRQSTKYRAAHYLLGRLFTENMVSTTKLRGSVITPWLIQGRIRVMMAKYGLIKFVLPSEEAKIWVIKRTPWVITDKILHLCPWTPVITKKSLMTRQLPHFRVQLWDIKEDFCTQQFGGKW
ncbi:unnamed protein product [Linum trigynum]|uniref:DUF4283 domain-containing protein n=1 Tax=Linum trigynum TaxID=586398 RepID=A0AAV2CYX0_9ROSI